MNILCRLGFHRFTAWSEPEPTHIPYMFSLVVDPTYIQRRTCLLCGIVETRTIGGAT